MNKTLKILLIVLLVISLAFVITGCGKKDETEEKTQSQDNAATDVNNTNTSNENKNAEPDNGKSKTYNTFSKLKNSYTMSIEEATEEEGTTVITMAIKDKKMYIDATAEGQHITIIYKDDATYMISHDEKMYMVSEGKSEDMFSDTELISADELKDIETADFKTGKETIDGVEYDYEEFNKDGTERYYFLGNELKYVKQLNDGEEETIKINKISSDVDDSLFEIPEGYTKMEI